jgi:hypothetical protein
MGTRETIVEHQGDEIQRYHVFPCEISFDIRLASCSNIFVSGIRVGDDNDQIDRHP